MLYYPPYYSNTLTEEPFTILWIRKPSISKFFVAQNQRFAVFEAKKLLNFRREVAKKKNLGQPFHINRSPSYVFSAEHLLLFQISIHATF